MNFVLRGIQQVRGGELLCKFLFKSSPRGKRCIDCKSSKDSNASIIESYTSVFDLEKFYFILCFSRRNHGPINQHNGRILKPEKIRKKCHKEASMK